MPGPRVSTLFQGAAIGPHLFQGSAETVDLALWSMGEIWNIYMTKVIVLDYWSMGPTKPP